ncbi:hypothetical protein CLV59_101291 [Chitinophaga dinghuensis]|uniref:DUF4350 domain-containing protein n=1 Tax=Chitinophaga dinghuensis TaxID=1539050 RepID=A0A327WBK8_9BACT|nr:DUF4350 domain-containing protein [Chitinophaga dinghuensis]RAJ87539.1 hypothetical protein CLV59_101291 [Chitinophaga dinghuensis]
MSRKFYYIAGTVIAILIALLMINSIQSNQDEQRSNDMSKPTFSGKDKKAGGTYAARELLPSLFNNQTLQVVTKSFASTYRKEETLKNSGSVYIIVAEKLFVTEQDVTDMLKFVGDGNELFIAANQLDQNLKSRLGIETEVLGFGEMVQPGVQNYLDSVNKISASYRYNGPMLERYFSKWDSSRMQILGTSAHNEPNFASVRVGSGFVYILLNPYTFTNYFVLHNQNAQALAIQMSYLDPHADNVYWDEFYNTQKGPRNSEFSEWQVLLKYPAFRWALWLSIILMLLYVAFESKRRQRIIPLKPVVANASLEFVDAIGQLYYQQQNHANISHKMVTHALEYIRTRYYINTNVLDDDFATLLSNKSDAPIDQVRRMTSLMKVVQDHGYIDSEFVTDLYRSIQLFYLNTK